MADSYAGKLLVATPSLVDPNFARSVVFMCAHDEAGSLGVILNRPALELEIREHLPDWGAHASRPPVLFNGGPVERTRALGLARYQQGTLRALESDLPHGISLVDLTESAEETAVTIDALRVFVGYSGWGAGQLEREIGEEAWFVVEADADDPFTPEPDRLWHRVLRRQRGRLAMFAYFPPDPAMN
ncbi:MAG: YqgE/AlgH family protein [Dehalococcoidia bacterium]|nr:YqgE/AlgH family protein [Dehalococcoidia bacterium]